MKASYLAYGLLGATLATSAQAFPWKSEQKYIPKDRIISGQMTGSSNLYEAARAAEKAGKYQDARKLFLEIIDQGPQHKRYFDAGEWIMNRLPLSEFKNLPREAIIDYQASIDSRELAKKENDPVKKLQHYERALKLNLRAESKRKLAKEAGAKLSADALEEILNGAKK